MSSENDDVMNDVVFIACIKIAFSSVVQSLITTSDSEICMKGEIAVLIANKTSKPKAKQQ